MKILIVDDDRVFHILLEDILKDKGYEVFHAHGPEEGIRLFEEKRADLVLLDVHMPVMSGSEVAPILKDIAKRQDRFAAILFFTASKDDHELVACIDAGGDDIISKPFNENLLEVKLRAWDRNIQLINEKQMEGRKGLSSFSQGHLTEEELMDLLMPSSDENKDK